MDADLAALAAAQTEFLTEATTDPASFGPPPVAHWDASHVVAHLLVNERLLLATTEAIAAGEDVDYDNAPSQDGFVLARTIAESGDLATLAARLADAFVAGRAALEGLTAGQRDTEVPVRVWHEGERVVDGPRPWWAFAVGASAAFHLPAHVRQLGALRAASGQ